MGKYEDKDVERLLEALRPVAIVGNRLNNTGKVNKYEFLAPSGYLKAYEVYNEIKNKYKDVTKM